MDQTKKRVILRGLAVLSVFAMIMGFFPMMRVQAAYENDYTNTGNQREDIVRVAETQVDYHEGSSTSDVSGNSSGKKNYTKYNNWFGSLSGYGYSYAWCQTFVAWCANQAGISTSVIPRKSGTVDAKTTFQSWGVYHVGPYEGGSYTPQRGDIIYFYSSGADSKHHVGIVTDCSNGVVYTIEGNASDQVKRRQYSVSESTIRGYAVPNYSGGSIEQEPSNMSIQCDKSSYAVGETITFNFTVDNATEAYVLIDANGVRVEPWANVTGKSTYSCSFDEPGYYVYRLYAKNAKGEPATEWQSFMIYDNIKGDANNDGTVTLADAVMLQKWLLNVGDLTCWENVDLYEDGKINVFDLCLLKCILLETT